MSSEVLHHYSSLSSQRSRSSDITSDPTGWLRRSNNSVKAWLLERTFSVARYDFGEVVLDLGCGKGGDLIKLYMCGVMNLVCVDSTARQLEDLAQRKDSLTNAHRSLGCGMNVKRTVSDLCTWQGRRFISPTIHSRCAVVCINFAMHYMCPDFDALMHLLRRIKGVLRNGGCLSVITAEHEPGKTHKSSVCEISPISPPKDGGYGSVSFTLRGSVENVPEYCVPGEDIIRCCRLLGMDVVLSETLRSVYEREIMHSDLEKRVNAKFEAPCSSAMGDQLKVMEMYRVWIVRKREGVMSMRG